MKENDVEFIATQFGITKEIVQSSVTDGTLSQRIKDAIASNGGELFKGKIIYKSEEDFNDFKKNYATEIETKYFSDLVEKAKKGDIPQDLYKPVKGSAYQQLERELSKKYDVSEFKDVFDLVDKLKAKPAASGNEELLKQIKDLQTVNERLQHEKDDAVAEVEKKYKALAIDDKKSSYLNAVPFDFTDVKQEELAARKQKTQTMLKSVFDSLYTMDVGADGGYIVKDKSGEVLKNAATLKPIPAEDVLISLAKDYNMKLLSSDPGGQGGSSSGQSSGTYKTVEEFEADMAAKGIKTTDPKYTELYRKSGLSKHLK